MLMELGLFVDARVELLNAHRLAPNNTVVLGSLAICVSAIRKQVV